MGATTTLLASIASAIGTHLGGTYSALDYMIDPSKNGGFKSKKKYGVRAGPINQVSGTTNLAHYEQDFSFTITDEYIEKTGDIAAREKAAALQDLVLSTYRHLISVKCGSAIVVNCRQLAVSDPEFNTSEKIVSTTGTFIVRYKES